METRTPRNGRAAVGPGREEAAPCLLCAHDAMREHPDLDGEGLQLWFDFEEAAFRYGVDPDLPREELLAAAHDGCATPCPKVPAKAAAGAGRPAAAAEAA